MRCTNCDYPLWNLDTRQCPECGDEFKPSSFDFVMNSVAFCCPHCEQDYYGTGPRGHLVPSTFDCVKCGREVSMDEMILRPAAGVKEAETAVDGMPWLDREKVGRVRAWFKTLGMALISPGRMMTATPVESSTGQAFWFCAVTTIITMFLAFVPMMCFMLLPFMAAPPGGGGGGAGAMALGMGMGLALTLVFGVLGSFLFLVIWWLTVHGILALGGDKRAGMGRTMQCLCYSGGANIMSAVPCIGSYLGWVWWLVSAVIAVKDGQKVSGGRASLAVLTFPVITIVGAVLLYVAFFAWMIAAGAGQGGFGGGVRVGETQGMGDMLMNQELVDGQWPGHALELLDDDVFGADNFVSWSGTLTTIADIPVGDTDLEQISFMGPNMRESTLTAFFESQPADLVAHRVGDFVFTYHGVDVLNGDPGLWLVVFSPDADLVHDLDLGDRMIVYTLDGQAQSIAGVPSTLLMQQNNLRAAEGLPPLPDPDTITHGAPVRGGG